MRAVRGAVISSKPVALAKAARVLGLFAASDASGLPADAGALVLYAAEAAAELHAFRCNARESRVGLDGEAAAHSGEKRRRKSEADRESGAADRDA